MLDPDGRNYTTNNCWYSIFSDPYDKNTVHIEIETLLQWTAEDLFTLADSLYDKGIELAGEEVFIKWNQDHSGLTAEAVNEVAWKTEGPKGPVGPSGNYDKVSDSPGANGPTGGFAEFDFEKHNFSIAKSVPILQEYKTKFIQGETVIFTVNQERYIGIIEGFSLDRFSKDSFRYSIRSGLIIFNRNEDEIEKYA